MDLEHKTDEELDEIRRAALAEVERRKKLEEGKAHIGQVVRDFMHAAKLECHPEDDTALGALVVALVIARTPSEEPQEEPSGEGNPEQDRSDNHGNSDS